jgi:transcription elongation factor Elf1
MGKRKKSSSKPQGPKKREPLSTTFTCLFCNHEKAIQVKLDKKAGVGNLHCKVCGQRFQTGINYLSAAVDVYSDWIDACENVAQEAAAQEAEDRKFSDYATAKPGATAAAGVADEEDGGYDDDY